MSEQESRDLRDEIMTGLDKSFTRLVTSKKKDNADMAFAEKGEVYTVRAVEI